MTVVSVRVAIVIAAFASTLAAAAPVPARAQQILKSGDTLSGELNAMRSRVKGKRVRTFQLTSKPRRLPGPTGLCNLETGPETFELVTSSDAEAKQLTRLVGKTVTVKVDGLACAQEAGQLSDAIVNRWSVITSH